MTTDTDERVRRRHRLSAMLGLPGRFGGLACVVGVDRVGQAGELRAHGADVVLSDLAELLDA